MECFLSMFLSKQNSISLKKKVTGELGAEIRNISFKLYFTTTHQNDALMGILLYVISRVMWNFFLKTWDFPGC